MVSGANIGDLYKISLYRVQDANVKRSIKYHVSRSFCFMLRYARINTTMLFQHVIVPMPGSACNDTWCTSSRHSYDSYFMNPIFVKIFHYMIQRIQSVWLFFATACIFSLFLFPYLQVLNTDGSASLIKVTGVYQSIAGQQVQTEAFLTLTIATVMLALIPFAIIFIFRDRKKQITLSYIAIALIIGFSFWLIQTAKGVLGPVELQAENYGVGSLIPSISIIFLILAIRGMKKDDRLIKSADRLR